MSAYYNEHDAFAAAWLRELIKRGLIADGEVDERDIREVRAEDLRGFTQCHFFAGIGVWSYALRCAGWEDSEPVWTGSCPCQPFSVSGKRAKASDERHLWPEFFRLIGESRPVVIFGEQVASDDGLAWLDLVSSDLEGCGYTVGAVDTPAAGYGAPHIRQRLYFCAHTAERGLPLWTGEEGREQPRTETHGLGATGERSHAEYSGHHRPQGTTTVAHSHQSEEQLFDGDASDGGDSAGDGWGEGRPESAGQQGRLDASLAGPTNGFWADCDWWYGRDGKYRPIEPGLFPLAHGVAKRVGKLRGYGNAIVAPQATEFIRAAREVMSGGALPRLGG